MFHEVYRCFKMRKGVKECAQRATILAVWAVETPHCLPLPYIYVGVWAQVFGISLKLPSRSVLTH